MKNTITKAVLSVDEFAATIGVGRTTAYRLFKERKVRLVRIGRRTLIPIAEVDALLAALANEHG